MLGGTSYLNILRTHLHWLTLGTKTIHTRGTTGMPTIELLRWRQGEIAKETAMRFVAKTEMTFVETQVPKIDDSHPLSRLI